MPGFHHPPALCDFLCNPTVSIIIVIHGILLNLTISEVVVNVNPQLLQRKANYALPEIIQGAGSAAKVSFSVSLDTESWMTSGSPIPSRSYRAGRFAAQRKSSV